jgi:predicted RNA binding protein YcfA (HicA-like mRNA interferase family)
MGKAAKLLQTMRNNPRDWRRGDLLTVAAHVGIAVRNHGGSHHVFKFPGIALDVTVPAHRPIKPVYVRNFIALVDKILESRHE